MDDIDRQFKDIEREIATIVAAHRNGEKTTQGQALKVSDWSDMALLATLEGETLAPKLKREGGLIARTLGERAAHIAKIVTGGYGREARRQAKSKAVKTYRESAALADKLDAALQGSLDAIKASREMDAKMAAQFNEMTERQNRAGAEAQAQVAAANAAIVNEATALQGRMTVSRPLQFKTKAP